MRHSKINGVQIDNTEDLEAVIPLYNLLEYSEIYWKTTGSLWNYYRDGSSDRLSSNFESFKYKTSITGNTYNVGAGEGGYDAESWQKWNWNCCTIKTFKRFLVNFKYTTD